MKSQTDSESLHQPSGTILASGDLTESEVPSPFLSGTNIQFAVDSTSIGLMKTCWRLYQYTILDGWATKGDAIHLRFGIEYHQALHDFENAKALGMVHEDAVRETVRVLLFRIQDFKPDPQTASEKLKSKDNLVRSVVWYLDHFKDDPAKTVILDNGKPAIELSFRFELDWGPPTPSRGPDDSVFEPNQPYILCGHLDRVVDFQDELYVMDRKTSSSDLSPRYFSQFEPNNQMTLYSLAAQVILSSPIRGVIIDAVNVNPGMTREGEPKKAFERSFTYRTKDQLEEWLYDLKYLLAQAETYAVEGYWPMNDTACDKFGGCKFKGICSKSPQVREQFLKSNFTKLSEDEKWNPLKRR